MVLKLRFLGVLAVVLCLGIVSLSLMTDRDFVFSSATLTRQPNIIIIDAGHPELS